MVKERLQHPGWCQDWAAAFLLSVGWQQHEMPCLCKGEQGLATCSFETLALERNLRTKTFD